MLEVSDSDLILVFKDVDLSFSDLEGFDDLESNVEDVILERDSDLIWVLYSVDCSGLESTSCDWSGEEYFEFDWEEVKTHWLKEWVW